MASSEGDLADLFNTCGACSCSFDRRVSKLLPCLHSICENCLDCCVAKCGRNTTPSCPVCSKQFLQKDVLVNVLARTQETAKDGVQVYTCTSCEDNQLASSYCGVCKECLCENCSRAHKRVRMTKDHAIRSIEEAILASYHSKTSTETEKPLLHCSVHKQEVLKLFCETCSKLTCRDCQLIEHKDHKFKFATDAVHDQRIVMQSYVAKMNSKLKSLQQSKAEVEERDQEIRRRKEETESLVTEASVEIMSHIVKWCQKLMKQVRDICQSRIDNLNVKKREISAKTSRSEFCLKLLENAIGNDDQWSLLYTKNVLISNLEEIITAENPALDENCQLNLLYKNNVKYLVDNVDKMGHLEITGCIPEADLGETSTQTVDRPSLSPLLNREGGNKVTRNQSPSQTILAKQDMDAAPNQNIKSAASKTGMKRKRDDEIEPEKTRHQDDQQNNTQPQQEQPSTQQQIPCYQQTSPIHHVQPITQYRQPTSPQQQEQQKHQSYLSQQQYTGLAHLDNVKHASTAASLRPPSHQPILPRGGLDVGHLGVSCRQTQDDGIRYEDALGRLNQLQEQKQGTSSNTNSFFTSGNSLFKPLSITRTKALVHHRPQPNNSELSAGKQQYAYQLPLNQANGGRDPIYSAYANGQTSTHSVMQMDSSMVQQQSFVQHSSFPGNFANQNMFLADHSISPFQETYQQFNLKPQTSQLIAWSLPVDCCSSDGGNLRPSS